MLRGRGDFRRPSRDLEALASKPLAIRYPVRAPRWNSFIKAMRRAHQQTSTLLALSATLLAASCGGSGGGGAATFVAKATTEAADPSFDPVVGGDFAAFLALEATTGPAGTDIDGDGTPDDKVTMGISLLNGVTTSTNLEADAVYILDGEFFLVVDEITNGVDYSGAGGIADLVLMHWNTEAGIDPVYVDDIERTASIAAVATPENLYYVTTVAQGAGTTNLRLLDPLMPTLPVTVGVSGSALSSCRILGDREGLLLVTVDENVDGDTDGDGDGTDSFALALLDATDVAAELSLTAVTIRGASTPFDAEALDVVGDGIADEGWLVAVLADEITEDVDLNDPSLFAGGWLPIQCSNLADNDKTDEVLHYIYFGHPTFATTPVNTGLVGRSRVLVVDGEYVATITPETDAGCDLNGDGLGDLIPRWCAAVDPALGSMGVLPPNAGTLMDALALAPAGGSLGLVKLEGNLVALVSEANDTEDHDSDGLNTHNLLAYIDDLDTDMTWDYDLGTPEGGFTVVGASWLGSDAVIDRIAVGFQESVVDLNLNGGCGAVLKDADKSDSVAAWIHFETGGLGIPGIGFSVDKFNMGGVFAGGNLFFRMDEADDDTDYNGNGTKTEIILTRNPVGAAGCAPTAIGTLHNLVKPAIFSDNVRGGVFMTDEDEALVDVNNDGDEDDFVLRWMRFL
ncbi:MAG: hypothetical protein ACI8Q9_001309 [Planctomycetota bacterium]|jgi:hypothetical protein